MIWVLWLQLTTATVCRTDTPCAPDTVHVQQLPTLYRTQEACATALKKQQLVYNRARETKVEGMKITTTAKLWCAEGAS